MLNFKDFYAKHFSQSSRVAFFLQQQQHTSSWRPWEIQGVADQPVSQEHPPQSFWQGAVPTGHESVAALIPQQFTCNLRDNHQIWENNAVVNAGEEEEVEGEGEERNEEEAAATQGYLTAEMIAIFEFSRKFRAQKEAAELLERQQIQERKRKRQKLTRLGYLPTEGDSGAESEPDSNDLNATTTTIARKNLFLDLHNAEEEVAEEDDEAAGDLDSGTLGILVDILDPEEQEEFIAEKPATDLSFLTPNRNARTRIYQRLYGADFAAGKTNGSEEMQESVRMVSMLEEILNGAYEDSMGPDSNRNDGDKNESNKATILELPDASMGTRGNKRGHGGGNYHHRKHTHIEVLEDQEEIVLWPGMPLRC